MARWRLGLSGISYKSIVSLDSPGVVVLDTSAVPDVIGLRARNNNTEPTRCYLGESRTVPNDRAAPWGFHDATIVDMAGATRSFISKEELSALRRHWPISVVTRMSKRQTDLELMRCDCKARFRSHPTGTCQ